MPEKTTIALPVAATPQEATAIGPRPMRSTPRTSGVSGGPRYRRMTLLATALLGSALLAVPASAAKDDLDLVSRATSGVAANGDSDGAAISANGRFIAFESEADNLDGDTNTIRDIFVRDLKEGTTTVVSRPPPGAGGGPGLVVVSPSSDPAISATGRFVAFSSSTSNLSDADDDTVENVFVRDGLRGGAITLVSRGPGPDGDGADADSGDPAISANGRFVAFESSAENLSSAEDEDVQDIFVRDLKTNTTTLVSRATGANGAGAVASSFDPTISADGRFVTFSSGADNLSKDDDNAVSNIFVRDLQENTTTLVSRASGATGTGADRSSFDSTISANGRFVAFDSSADNLSTDDNDRADIFVRDLRRNTTTLVSRASGANGVAAGDSSSTPTISANGRFVAFDSKADNLSKDDTTARNVFVRDLRRNTTTLVSRPPGAKGTGTDSSFNATISAGGRFVAFTSLADNLSKGDDDSVGNIFRRDVLGGPAG